MKKLTAAGLKKVHIMLTCDISTYSSSYIVNCADKYKLQTILKTKPVKQFVFLTWKIDLCYVFQFVQSSILHTWNVIVHQKKIF